MRRSFLFILCMFLLTVTLPLLCFGGETTNVVFEDVLAEEQSGDGHAFILSEETASPSQDDTLEEETEGVRHNYILVIDNSRSTTGPHSLGAATDPEGLRFDAARLVYENVLSSASLGGKGQIGVIVFCGPENCINYGPLDIDSDPQVMAETIGNYLNEEANEGHRDNYTDIRTALTAASEMMDGFSQGSDTSVILLTDGINDLTNQGDPFSQSVNTEANDDSAALAGTIHQKGADFFVVALTTETAVQNTDAFLVFINRMAEAGGGEQMEDGSYSNVLLATQSDLNSKLLQMLIKAESSSDSIQNIIEYTPLQETFTVPYEGISDATVNITFMPDDKEYLDKVELVTPSGEDLILWDQEGEHEQQGISISEDRSYIILEIPSPQAGDWNIIVTGRADMLQTSMSVGEPAEELVQSAQGTQGEQNAQGEQSAQGELSMQGEQSTQGGQSTQGEQGTQGDQSAQSGLAESTELPALSADEDHPVLINVVVRFNHNMRLATDLSDIYEINQPIDLNVRIQTFHGSEFEDLTDSDIYSQSAAELTIWAPKADAEGTAIEGGEATGTEGTESTGAEEVDAAAAGAEEPFAVIPMEEAGDHYTASFTPDAEGEWRAQVSVENPYVKASIDDLVFQVKEAIEVIRPEDIALSLTPSVVSEDGMAYLGRDAGMIALTWEVTGETESVEAALLKEGEVIHKGLKGDEVIDPRKLEDGVQYALQVSVVPKDGAASGTAPVVATLPFQLAPEVVPIQAVTLDLQPRIDDRDEMVYADKSADAWTVSWTVDGETDAVTAALYEEGNDEPLMTDLASGDVIESSLLSEGKTYLLRVEAIPKNGLLAGAEPFTQEMAFQLYPDAEPVTGLVLEVIDGELSEGVYTMKKNHADLAWNLESGNVDHFELHVTDPQGGDFLQTSLAAGTRNYTLEMDQRGEYQVELTAVPRYALTEEMNASAAIVVSPHIPGFIEKYWPFLAGGAGLLILLIAVLLILKSSKSPRVYGSIQIDCEEPDLSFHKHLDFIPDRQGLKYGQPITRHPILASMEGQKVYEVLKHVYVSMVQTDASGRIAGSHEDGSVTHRPNASAISLTYKDPKMSGSTAVCYVGEHDIGTSTMVLKDGAGKEYTFRFGNT